MLDRVEHNACQSNKVMYLQTEFVLLYELTKGNSTTVNFVHLHRWLLILQ